MTLIVAFILLLLVVGIAEALVKRMLRLAAILAVIATFLLGATIYVIATMR